MGSKRISKEVSDRYGRIIWEFFDKSQKYKKVKAKFGSIKTEFEEKMEELFDGRSCNSITAINENVTDGEPNAVKVTRVERAVVRWDVEKLRRRIPADVFKKVVKKEYRIVGMQHLIQYLKSCGVDPRIFKQYIVVDESVDHDAIDKMGDLGYITPQQVSGCYVVDCSKPYFNVSAVKKKENE